ncbi:dihydrolipoamide acetyltransferase family protein [Streptomyces sp. NPDC020845]|uniref:dihydrolipoamide acetyltransferase family protein n=1 Tax=Streptomyces sp. NPDC020845 TaxID=3365096 RepID=UPI0037A7D6C6
MTTLIEIRLPHMGSVERAVITTWHKGPGDKVALDEPLLDVSTDKVETEVASPQEGTLVEILAHPDQEVPVGELIARFAPLDASDAEITAALGGEPQVPAAPAPAEPAHAAPAPAPPQQHPEPAQQTHEPHPAPSGAPPVPAVTARQDLDGLSLVLTNALRYVTDPAATDHAAPPTSPLVRRMAKEAGMDLRAVRGTGRGGRVTRNDVRAHLEAAATPKTPPAPAEQAPATAPPAPPTPSAQPATATPRPDGYEAIPCEEVPLTPTRKAIAAHMVASVSTAPQLTAQVDVDFTHLAAARAAVNVDRARQGRDKLSYLPFIARALVAVIGEHPDINATFTDTHLLRWRTVNLGIAVDVEAGLYVPVMRDAQRLSLDGMAETITDLAQRTRDRRLTAADLQGGTITISNSGSVGGVTSTPILTRPQVASLGVPAVIRQPVAVTGDNGEEYIAIRPVARLGLTFDHRAMDGSAALRALNALQHALQEWPAEAYR